MRLRHAGAFFFVANTVFEIELGHRGVLQPRWVQKMHRGGVDFEVEGGCAVEFTRISSTSDPPREVYVLEMLSSRWNFRENMADFRGFLVILLFESAYFKFCAEVYPHSEWNINKSHFLLKKRIKI